MTLVILRTPCLQLQKIKVEPVLIHYLQSAKTLKGARIVYWQFFLKIFCVLKGMMKVHRYKLFCM